MAAPFGATWGTLIERCEELPDDATLITPLANTHFRIRDVQQPRIIIEDTDSGESQPFDREQFATLAERAGDGVDRFDFERMPPQAELYAAVLGTAVP